MRRPFAGLVALLAVVAVVATACGSLQPYALIVNGSRIQQHDVDNELKAIRGNGRYLDAIDPSRQQVLGSGTGTFNSDFTAFILNQDLDYELVRQEVAKRKLRIYEVGISYWGRTYEEGKKIGWKDGFRALWCLLKYSIKGHADSRAALSSSAFAVEQKKVSD